MVVTPCPACASVIGRDIPFCALHEAAPELRAEVARLRETNTALGESLSEMREQYEATKDDRDLIMARLAEVLRQLGALAPPPSGPSG